MIVSKTPLRISFFSGGSDIPSFYQHEDGAAFSITIDKHIYVTLHKVPHLGVKVSYDKIENVEDIGDMEHEITKQTLQCFDITKEIHISSISDILAKGSGLGSSSAFTVGLVNALSAYKKKPLSYETLADVACDIEMNRCGYPIGRQDQYAAAYGGANLFRFHRDHSVTVEKVNVENRTLITLEQNLLLVYSGKQRQANEILQKQKQAMMDCTKFKLVAKARDKAFEAVNYLRNNNPDAVGQMLHEAWMDKKQVVEGISQSYFDVVYDKAIDAGAIGGKLLGAGGGGFFLFYVPLNKRAQVISAVQAGTECKAYDFSFTSTGSKIVLNT